MTPLAFEARYQAEWQELEELLDGVLKRTSKASKAPRARRASRGALSARMRASRAWRARVPTRPICSIDLDRLTADAHQVIYQQREFGAAALWRIVSRDFPRAVRADGSYVWLATALFVVPTARARRARLLTSRR